MRVHFVYLLLMLLIVGACKSLQTHKPKQYIQENEKGKVTFQKIALESYEKSQIKGVVRNVILSDVEEMPYCRVTLYEGETFSQGVITNEKGEFNIDNIQPKKYIVKFIATGFETIELPLNLEKPRKVILDVEMKHIIIQIEKPVLYLYPEEKQAIEVQVDFQGALTHTYPTYPKGGWKVIAAPDGTIWDEKGQTYYALFWEGKPTKPLHPQSGFVVKGEETATFLEEKLAYLGLNRREANEFIMYWLPRMQDNPYNLIHFAGDEYEAQAPLVIQPQPTTLIRVMMLTKPLQTPVDFPLQNLQPLHKTRKGFTVVEWGGSEWKDNDF